MKPRRRPAPTSAAKKAAKAKEDRQRRRGLENTRRAVRTGAAVARALGPIAPPRGRRPPRRNARTTATTVTRPKRVVRARARAGGVRRRAA